MSDFLSFLLPKDWMTTLVKQLDGLSGQRRRELDQLFFEFGDWKELAKFYVEPDAQIDNPADYDERKGLPMWVRRIAIRDWINQFLEKRFKNRDGHNTLFILADAGMGKSSLLTMLKLNDLQAFWPKQLKLELLKLGPETLEHLRDLRGRASNTVLLLDALDEDRSAWGQVGPRIQELLHEVTSFRHAIITCRTQYFPSGTTAPSEGPKIEPGKIQLGGYECNLLYLSPFNRDQIDRYLETAYPNSLRTRVSRWLWGKPDHRHQIRGVIESMGDLSMRPLLLAYIEDLVDRDFGPGSEYAIYHRLVDRWLGREVVKLTRSGIDISVAQLWDACVDLAVELQRLGRRSLSQSQLDAVLGEASLKSALQSFKFGGRSLLNRNGQGEYRFAHYSIQEFLVVYRVVEGSKKPGACLRVTDQILKFLLSWDRQHREPDRIPWEAFDFSGVELEAVGDLWNDERKRILEGTGSDSLSDLDPDPRGEALLKLSEASSPSLALLLIDLQRQQTRNGDDLYHLELAAEIVGRRHPEQRQAVEELRGRFYDHIPEPPAGLFETVKTADGVVDLWCEVPTGTYSLGSPAGEEGRASWERIRHTADIQKPFALAAVPVTQAQYRAFDPSHESRFKGEDRPVEQVSWWAAMAFCRWLAGHSATSGARLPTEEEWEIACRAGTTTRYWSGDEGKDLDRVGWFGDNSGGKTHPVGRKPANPWGLHDVHGNVWEWAASPWSDPDPNQGDVVVNPSQAASADLPPSMPTSNQEPAGSADSPADPAGTRRARRVIRGGGCWGTAQGSRSAYRDGSGPGARGRNLGFRVLLPLASPRL